MGNEGSGGEWMRWSDRADRRRVDEVESEVGIDTFKSNGALLSSVSYLINSSFQYF